MLNALSSKIIEVSLFMFVASYITYDVADSFQCVLIKETAKCEMGSAPPHKKISRYIISKRYKMDSAFSKNCLRELMTAVFHFDHKMATSLII